MSDMSIRTRIITGVILVNLAVGVVVAVHLHQTFSRGLEVASTASLERTSRAWQEVSTHPDTKLDFATLEKSANEIVTRMQQDTGGEYGLLLARPATEATAPLGLGATTGLPVLPNGNRTYVMAGVSNPSLAGKMLLSTPPDAIPESGKTTGIENGACSKTCHGRVKGSGDFWRVTWSADANTRAYAALPISDDTGKPVGVIYSITDISSQANADRASLLSSLSVMFIGLAVSTILIAVLLNGLVFHRLENMIRTMRSASARLAGGDFSVEFVADGTKDEIGTFEEFFAEFLNLMSALLRSVSEQLKR